MSFPSAPPSDSGAPPSGSQRVLVIDDDRELCDLIKDYLEPLGYEVLAEHDGRRGAERALQEPLQAVILDVMMPQMDGFEVLRRLRSESNVPILMLTSRGDETDRIVGLEMGADDYLPKTFSPRELLARLRAVTRRSVRASPPPPPTGAEPDAATSEVIVGPLRIRFDTRSATLEGQLLKLTSLEFEILACLARAKGRVKTREQLIETVAERNYDGLDRSIDVHIWSLRKKLGDDPKQPRFIKTLRSMGYMLLNPSQD